MCADFTVYATKPSKTEKTFFVLSVVRGALLASTYDTGANWTFIDSDLVVRNGLTPLVHVSKETVVLKT